MAKLSPENSYIFRITHVDNIPWILRNGLHSRNSATSDPNFRSIGNLELIQSRQTRVVPIPPGGTLSDYVPFYFTPWSPMLLNIKTGYGGIQIVPNDQIVIMASSLRKIAALNLPFVFTNQHAYPVTAKYFNNVADLNEIDWPVIRSRNFKHDPEDPDRKSRYMAEALVYNTLPVSSLIGMACNNEAVAAHLKSEIARNNLTIDVASQPTWYF